MMSVSVLLFVPEFSLQVTVSRLFDLRVVHQAGVLSTLHVLALVLTVMT
jgi:hypothetical protein